MESILAKRINSYYSKFWWVSIFACISFVAIFASFIYMVGVPDLYSQNTHLEEIPSISGVLGVIVPLFILTFILFVLTIVYVGFFIYNVWLTVARKDDSIVPCARVILLFVPYVQLVINFLLLYEFAVRANQFLLAEKKQPLISSNGALVYSILQLLCSVVPIFLFPLAFIGSLGGGSFLNFVMLNPLNFVVFEVLLFAIQIVSLLLLLQWVIQARKAGVCIAQILYEKSVASQNSTQITV